MTQYEVEDWETGREVYLAKAYLKLQPWSYEGLLRQLKFDGNKHPEETLRQLDIDWKEQAKAAARVFLEQKHGVEEELVMYLKEEGFTEEEIKEVLVK